MTLTDVNFNVSQCIKISPSLSHTYLHTHIQYPSPKGSSENVKNPHQQEEWSDDEVGGPDGLKEGTMIYDFDG